MRLTKKDYNMLHQIYLLRCLSLRQIYETFYKGEYRGLEDLRDNKIKELIEENILMEEDLVDSSIYFLNRKGIDLVVAQFNKPLNIIDEQTGKIKKGYYTASELKLNNKLIKHQIYLNQFVLDFKRIYKLKEYKEKWSYFDEKYLSQYTRIRPDGMIRLKQKDLFLEMDMNSESYQQLCEKWKRYSMFLHTPEYRTSSQNILVLFIIDGTTNPQNRKKIIETSIKETISNELCTSFDIIIGTREELLFSLFNMILPDVFHNNTQKVQLYRILANIHNFRVSDTGYFYKYINGWHYGFYARKVNKENQIKIEKNKLQAYFIDYYVPDMLSIISKIANYTENLALFNAHYNWTPSYVIVCEDADIKNIKELLLLFNIIDRSNLIYITTLNRLTKYSFDEAIIPINQI